MKMIEVKTRQNSLSLSGGHIIIDHQMSVPSYSPIAVQPSDPFPWEDDVNEINTPDIDPSFFDGHPFKKFSAQTSQSMDLMATEDNMFSMNPISYATIEDSQQLISQTMEENCDINDFINQNQTISEDINGFKEPMVSPNDVLENQYIPASTSPVLHYLQPRYVESIASTLNSQEVIATDTYLTNQSVPESLAQFSSPSHSSSQSYSPALSTAAISQSYVSPIPSPALSYTSSSSNQSTLLSTDAITSDTVITIDGIMERKPDLDFLQPTVIDDHLYTLPSTSTSKRRKSSTDNKDKYLVGRKKNNMASKKSRVTKRDKQKQMEDQIHHYIEDNAKCKSQIEQMEREIEWCKSFLFKKVVASARS